MYKLKTLHEKLNENYNHFVWRNTNYKWLYELLSKKTIKSKRGRFISFSMAEDSGGQDDYGGTRIKFNRTELDKQGLIEVYYDYEFFERYPEISRYVTGYKSEKEYYENLGYSGPEEANNNLDLTWEEYIEGYEGEEELVLKNLKFNENLILNVSFIKDRPSKNLINLLKINNITYEI